MVYSKETSPFLIQVRKVIRTKRLSYSTEKSYLHYIVDYIHFNHKKHPKELGEIDVQNYLSHLALEGQVAASTQNVALCALLFLYQQVLGRELANIDAVRAKRPKRLPVVFSKAEVQRILTALKAEHLVYQIIIALLYGTVIRLLLACICLRYVLLHIPRKRALVSLLKFGKLPVIRCNLPATE